MASSAMGAEKGVLASWSPGQRGSVLNRTRPWQGLDLLVSMDSKHDPTGQPTAPGAMSPSPCSPSPSPKRSVKLYIVTRSEFGTESHSHKTASRQSGAPINYRFAVSATDAPSRFYAISR